MPVVEIRVPESCDAKEIRRLSEAVADAARRALPDMDGALAVSVRDGRGGKGLGEGGACDTDPATLVRDYLAAMERRDLNAAASMLGEGFSMQFPGAPRMARLEELVEWSRPRYRFVAKTYERFDSVPGDPAIVYCFGTLSGEWNSGDAFEDIRFIDRFEISNGKITRQDVWNDMAEVRGHQ